jgi:hypothetical protein
MFAGVTTRVRCMSPYFDSQHATSCCALSRIITVCTILTCFWCPSQEERQRQEEGDNDEGMRNLVFSGNAAHVPLMRQSPDSSP